MYDGRAELVNRVAEYLIRTFSQEDVPLVKLFVSQYLMSVSSRDLAQKDTLDLFGSIVSHWNFIQSRDGDFKVRVHNPKFEVNSWSSVHTIVEVNCPNKPFLLDSIRMALLNQGVQLHLIVNMNKLYISRNDKGALEDIKTESDEDMDNEVSLYIEVSRQDDEHTHQLQDAIEEVIGSVFQVVQDFPVMRTEIQNNIFKDKNFGQETQEFCNWLFDEDFVFLGVAQFDLEEGKGFILDKTTSLGLFKFSCNQNFLFDKMRPQLKEALLSQDPLIIGKFHEKSVIHRPVYLDALYIKNFSSDGSHIESFSLILGLFTAKAYKQSLFEIPFVSKKVFEIFKLSSIDFDSHDGRLMEHVIDTFGVDDFFYADAEDLFEMVFEVYQIRERPLIKLFAIPDVFGNFYSCYVYVPRDIFNSTLREKIQGVLLKSFGGQTIDFQTRFSESILARIHFVIRGEDLAFEGIDIDQIEKQVQTVSRHWKDDFHDMLNEHLGEEKGSIIFSSFRSAFSPSYCDFYTPRQAVSDINFIEYLKTDRVALNFFQPIGNLSEFRLKIFQKDKSLILSDVIPILESFGLKILRDRLFEIHRKEGVIWLNDFLMTLRDQQMSEEQEVFDNFITAFKLIWDNNAECDKFNELILTSGLTIYHVIIIRAIAKYLRQIKFNFSQPYIEATCCEHPKIVMSLIKYFEIKFNPDLVQDKRQKELVALEEHILQSLDLILNLDQDKILRRYFEIMKAITRTNFFQKEGNGQKHNYLSFKFDPRKISGMPLPVVRHEIYVYSPNFEGVHLRTGDVARGGLRWSDRLEDFRTEILGLVKAQQVKNSLIVPEGAKGGFIVKTKMSDMSSEKKKACVIECYQNFIRGLLDITDNYSNGKVVSPENLVYYDELNPYLVVAADKGTATFSDIANDISCVYNFWLNDAFASGGSQGYDHKKMGITAKGAWEAVKRHFREKNLDVDRDEFSVLGIGDMSGDVFGNGMLLSRKIKLVAAFNHLHIFIDPQPDIEQAYQERERLFIAARGSWDKYDESKISIGGGVFSRKTKYITLTPEIKELCQLTEDKMSPDDLIQVLLKLPVDLIFNGGIGTFVKSSAESHIDVGDKANDGLRVNANDMRCLVFAEGGNLGITQRGRIEFAHSGGAINTDSLDNSGGVDCSDHEVNIKIFLDKLVQDGELTIKQRNELLLEMTDDVLDLVLSNNYRQNRAISFASHYAARDLNLHERIIEDLSHRGKLDRAIEFLPNSSEMAQRAQESIGLTRPELFILYSYVKLDIKQKLVTFDFEKYPLIEDLISREFPTKLSTVYKDQLKEHPLKAQILSTLVANIILDELGISYVYRLMAETKASVGDIMIYTFKVRELYNTEELLDRLDGLTSAPHDMIQRSVSDTCRLVRRATRWIHYHLKTTIDMKQWHREISDLERVYPDVLRGQSLDNYNAKIAQLVKKKVPANLARQIASLPFAVSALDLISLSLRTSLSTRDLSSLYFILGERLHLEDMREDLASMDVTNYWEALSRSALRDDIDRYHIEILASMVEGIEDIDDSDVFFKDWASNHQESLVKWDKLVEQISLDSHKSQDFLLYSVSIRELKTFLPSKY